MAEVDEFAATPTDQEEAEDVFEPVSVVNGTLSLAGRDLREVPLEIGQQFASTTKTLDLSFNQLTTLKNLELFNKLETLVLDNNEVENLDSCSKMPTLRTFSANKNNLADIDSLLQKLKELFPQLQYLSLLKNPACPHALIGGDDEDYQRYRHRVIYNLPNLKFLDSKQINAAEKKEANRVGPFLKVARPDQDQVEKQRKAHKETNDTEYRPLPSDLTPQGEHSGTFGQCKYVYYGRHSEGNRFIRNNDL